MKKSIYNIIFGVLGQVITIIVGLMLPRLRIVSFGSEVNGMLSSVHQVYTYLALLEAGVGSATLQALYGPIAKGDRESVNSILSATNSYYKKTGYVYLASIVAFAVIYPLVVATDIPKTTIVLVILLNGLGNVLAFFFQGKYRILLQAEGKEYILSNLTTFVTVFSGIAKVVLIYAGCDVISLQFAYFIFNLLQVAYFSWYIKRHYKWIDLKVSGDYTAISQKNSVLIHQISQMVFNNTDVLILTVFCGLKVVSVYAVYILVFDMISVLITNVNNGFSYKLGQLFNSDRPRFMTMYNFYERCYTALSFGLYCVAFLFISNFIELYTAGVKDIDYTMKYLPIMFTMIKLMVSGRATSGFIASYAGHFKKTQNRAIIEAVINLTVSLVGVNFFGIYGVLMGTIVALIYRANDMIIYANKVILNRSPWYTYKWWVLDIGIFVAIVTVFDSLHLATPTYLQFFVTAGISAVLIVSVFVGITLLCSRQKPLTILKNFIKK